MHAKVYGQYGPIYSRGERERGEPSPFAGCLGGDGETLSRSLSRRPPDGNRINIKTLNLTGTIAA